MKFRSTAFMRNLSKLHIPHAVLRTRMTVTARDRVKRFVMQYGSHARVLAPEELCDEIRAELSRRLRRCVKRKDKQDQ